MSAQKMSEVECSAQTSYRMSDLLVDNRAPLNLTLLVVSWQTMRGYLFPSHVHDWRRHASKLAPVFDGPLALVLRLHSVRFHCRYHCYSPGHECISAYGAPRIPACAARAGTYCYRIVRIYCMTLITWLCQSSGSIGQWRHSSAPAGCIF